MLALVTHSNNGTHKGCVDIVFTGPALISAHSGDVMDILKKGVLGPVYIDGSSKRGYEAAILNRFIGSSVLIRKRKSLTW